MHKEIMYEEPMTSTQSPTLSRWPHGSAGHSAQSSFAPPMMVSTAPSQLQRTSAVVQPSEGIALAENPVVVGTPGQKLADETEQAAINVTTLAQALHEGEKVRWPRGANAIRAHDERRRKCMAVKGNEDTLKGAGCVFAEFGRIAFDRNRRPKKDSFQPLGQETYTVQGGSADAEVGAEARGQQTPKAIRGEEQ